MVLHVSSHHTYYFLARTITYLTEKLKSNAKLSRLKLSKSCIHKKVLAGQYTLNSFFLNAQGKVWDAFVSVLLILYEIVVFVHLHFLNYLFLLLFFFNIKHVFIWNTSLITIFKIQAYNDIKECYAMKWEQNKYYWNYIPVSIIHAKK